MVFLCSGSIAQSPRDTPYVFDRHAGLLQLLRQHGRIHAAIGALVEQIGAAVERGGEIGLGKPGELRQLLFLGLGENARSLGWA